MDQNKNLKMDSKSLKVTEGFKKAFPEKYNDIVAKSIYLMGVNPPEAKKIHKFHCGDTEYWMVRNWKEDIKEDIHDITPEELGVVFMMPSEYQEDWK